MADLPQGEPEIPLETHQLRQQATIQLDGSYTEWKPELVKIAKQYIAISNWYGYICLVDPKGQGLLYAKTSDVLRRVVPLSKENDVQKRKLLDSEAKLFSRCEMKADVWHIALSPDELLLAVCTKQHVYIFDAIAIFKGHKTMVGRFDFKTLLLDFAWAPARTANQYQFMVLQHDGALLVQRFGQGVPKDMQTPPQKFNPPDQLPVTGGTWTHPNFIMLGHDDGSISRVAAESLETVWREPPPEGFEGCEAHFVHAITDECVLVGFRAPGNEALSDPEAVRMATFDPKNEEWMLLDDPTHDQFELGAGLSRYHRYQSIFFGSWNLGFLTSSKGGDIAVLGRGLKPEEDGGKMRVFELSDGFRASVGTGPKFSPAYSLGFRIDTTNSFPIVDAVEDAKEQKAIERPIAPMMFLLTTDGRLLLFSIVDTRLKKAAEFMKPAHPLPGPSEGSDLKQFTGKQFRLSCPGAAVCRTDDIMTFNIGLADPGDAKGSDAASDAVKLLKDSFSPSFTTPNGDAIPLPFLIRHVAGFQHELQMKPTLPIEHECRVSVSLNGVELQGSPLSFFVTDHRRIEDKLTAGLRTPAELRQSARGFATPELDVDAVIRDQLRQSGNAAEQLQAWSKLFKSVSSTHPQLAGVAAAVNAICERADAISRAHLQNKDAVIRLLNDARETSSADIESDSKTAAAIGRGIVLVSASPFAVVDTAPALQDCADKMDAAKADEKQLLANRESVLKDADAANKWRAQQLSENRQEQRKLQAEIRQLEERLAALQAQSRQCSSKLESLEREERESVELSRFVPERSGLLEAELRGSERVLAYERSAWKLLAQSQPHVAELTKQLNLQCDREMLPMLAAAVDEIACQLKIWSTAHRVTQEAATKARAELASARKISARALAAKHETDLQALEADVVRLDGLIQIATAAKTQTEQTFYWVRDSLLARGVDAAKLQQLASASGGARESKADSKSGAKAAFEIAFNELQMSDKPLGEGSFSIVYPGRLHGTEVAVKMLKIQHNKDVLQTVKEELALWRNLRHPNILLPLAACFEPSHICVVSELMAGGSLFNALHGESPRDLTVRQKCSILLDIARALSYLHSQSIMHLDLSSHNVLLSPHLDAKVSDFGLSRSMSSSLTMTNSVGTVQWSAPERIAGEASAASDVYSFGVIAWEMFSGKAPFAGVPPAQVIGLLLRGKGQLALNADSDCPAALHALMQSCFREQNDAADSKSARPTSAALCETLESVLKELSADKDAGDSKDTEKKCVICYEAAVSVALQPCGHAQFCQACVDRVQSCPVCRARIAGRLSIFT